MGPVARRDLRRVRTVAAMTFVAAISAVFPVTPAAGTESGTTSGVTEPDPVSLERPDMDSASSLARQTNSAAEVTDLRGEAEDTWANPDGTFTLQSYAAPVRVRQGDSWADIDTSLRLAGSSVVPTATVADLRFSAGGAGPLATISKAGRGLSLSWPSALPVPRIEGSTATYSNVLPGVDLLVTAEADGFSEVLEVRDQAAAANPALASLSFGASTNGLTLKEGPDDSVMAVDAAGEVQFISAGSSAWDSSAPGSTGSCKGDPPDESKRPMPVEVEAGRLTVTPDRNLLTSADTVFPVCIDPPFTGVTNKWTHVWRGAPDSSFWGSRRDSMRVGRVWRSSTTDIWRSFVRIDISGIVNRGVQIVSAEFRSELDHSASCGPTSIALWNTDFVSPNAPATTWNNTNSFGPSGFWNADLGAAAGHANEDGGCGALQPDMLMTWSDPRVRAAVQGAANGSFGIMTFGLKAVDESDWSKWKRFYPGDSSVSWQRTYLSVTYNRKPNKPIPQPMAPCYLACSSPAVVRSTTPTMTANVSDADNPAGAILQTWFEVWDTTHTRLVAKNSSPVMAASGGRPTWSPPAGSLANATTYHWRVIVYDELNFASDWSDWVVFAVDTDRPAVPKVTSPNYPEKQWGPVEGTVATFNLEPATSTDVAEYWWSIDGHVAPTKVPTGDGTETLTWQTRGVVNRLQVFAVDRAGNTGDPKVYELWVTPPANRFSEWRLDETSGTTAADTGRNMVAPLPGSLSPGVSWIAGRVNNAARLTGTGTITTSGPVLDTTRSFSVAAWARPASLPSGSENATVLSQDGTKQSMFRLYYRGTNGRWCFSLRPGDDVAAPLTLVCSSATLPQVNEWVHLVGVYDATAGTISIYVNGGPDGDGSSPDEQATFTSAWMATGQLAIGRARAGSANAPGEYFGGDVDEVVAAQRALGPVEIGQLAGGGRMS